MAKLNKKQQQIAEYRTMGEDALNDHIEAQSIHLKRLKFSHAINPIENPASIKLTRRSIAQMKTEQRKRDLGI